MSSAPHDGLAPSAWVQRWSRLVPPGATVLDVACGSGRHVRWFAHRGCRVTGIDRDAAALAQVSAIAETLAADIENGPWPLPGRRFDAVIVTNYLWRPLWPAILDSIGDGGVLICETFARGNETVGKPSNPDFLLQQGELLQAAATLRIVAFEDGFLAEPDRFVQRLTAVREPAGSTEPMRYPL